MKHTRIEVGGQQGRVLTRRAIAGLHTEDGGHSYSSGLSFPILQEEDFPTPESTGAWWRNAQRILALAAFICVIAALSFFAKGK